MAAPTAATPDARPGDPVDAPVGFDRTYGFARGFSYRREAFGGLLYHYEGVAPDPRVTFVDHGFLIDLLDALEANPGVALDALIAGVVAHFRLEPADEARIVSFFATLIRRGALVAH